MSEPKQWRRDQVLPDARVTQAAIDSMTVQVEISAIRRNSDELMWLSGAFERAARRKRQEEQQRRVSSIFASHPRSAHPPRFGSTQ